MVRSQMRSCKLENNKLSVKEILNLTIAAALLMVALVRSLLYLCLFRFAFV